MTLYTESMTILHERVKPQLGWDTAIEEAEDQIKKCQSRIKQLRNSIRLARRQIDMGVPFDSSTDK